jgi:2-dehydro-3-deoxyphosphogalactonate aldolase
MRLTSVESYVINVPEGDRGSSRFLLIRLVTDEGIYGWGETAIGNCLHDIYKVYPVLIRECFEQFLKGNDPFERERLGLLLYGKLMNSHPDLVMSGIISAFDIALWDICGKVLGRPVYDLLGGKCRTRLRSYSYIYVPGNRDDPESIAEEALKMKEMGFTAVKYDPIPVKNENDSGNSIRPFQLSLAAIHRADSVMSAIRRAVGTDVDILVGTHGQTNTSAATRLAKILEQYNPLWFEEPVPPENRDEMAAVSHYTVIPVSTGERLTGLHEFREVLASRAARILQPDLGSCGGISAGYKIAALAESCYAEMAYHIWGGPVITAAALQLDAAIPNFLIQESIYDSCSGVFRQIMSEKFKWDNGYFSVSDSPGIGIELDMKTIKQYNISR